jgi:hypothetical protein
VATQGMEMRMNLGISARGECPSDRATKSDEDEREMQTNKITRKKRSNLHRP